MKSFYISAAMCLLICSLSSYVVEEREKVYVDRSPVVVAPVVTEEVDVDHIHHHHHHYYYHPELEVEVR